MIKKIELAPTEVVDHFEDTIRELFSEILEMNYYDCLITDEFCLCHMITEDTPEDYAERFRDKYGFELTTVHVRIAELARKIAQRRIECSVQ